MHVSEHSVRRVDRRRPSASARPIAGPGHRRFQFGPSYASVLLIALVALLFVVAGVGSDLGRPASSAHGPAAPASLQVVAAAGAPPGAGLTNPGALQARGPIHIDGNASFTAGAGVRSGSGSAADPYIISDWLIDMTSYPGTLAGVWIQHASKHVIIENVEVRNQIGSGNFFGILLGTNTYPPITTDWAENITVTHVLLQAISHGYGIESSYYTKNNNISFSAVFMNVTQQDWQYGITAQGGSQNITIWGNFVDARNAQTGPTYTLRTVGIQSGDGCIVYLNRTHPYPCATVTVAHNTVTNATAEAFVSDGTTHSSFFDNLGYQNYPGKRDISGYPSRGIMVESRSNYSRVHDNVFFQYDHGIEVGAWGGWYWNNSVHDNDWGIFVDTNNSFSNVAFALFNVIWNTQYYNNALGDFSVPSNGFTVLFDVQSGVTPTHFPIRFTNQGRQTIDSASYAWAGTDVNISYTLGTWGYMKAVTVYDHQPSSFSQNLSGAWSGKALALSVSQFAANDLQFSLQSATAAGFAGAGFSPSAYYEVYHASNQIAALHSDAGGNLSFSIPAPVSGSYELRYAGTVPLPFVSITAPSNNAYVTVSSPQVAWVASDAGPGLRSVDLFVDGGAAVNVTALTAYQLPSQADGNHTIVITATDFSGLSTSASVSFTIDTHAPSVAILTPTDNAVLNSSIVLVSWQATDAVSGINNVSLQLDSGSAVPVSGNNYSVGGLADGSHEVIVTAVDRAGLIGQGTVHFTVYASASGGSPPTPAVAEITFLPASSAVDISFTQPMNRSSVEKALQISPSANYNIQWLNDSHVRILLIGSLGNGGPYQLTLQPGASTTKGVGMEHPFLFQFYPGSSGPAAPSVNWLAVAVVFAALLGVNWAGAGLLVRHYRRKAIKVGTTLRQALARYQGSIVVVYKRLAKGRAREPAVVRKVRKPVPVRRQVQSTNGQPTTIVTAPFPRKHR